LAFARALGGGREEAALACDALALWLRDVLAAQAGGGTPALPDLGAETRACAAAVGPGEIVRRRDEALRTRAALRQNASPVLALERMLVRWFHARA
ncbi:MAG TPA: DNA polymerase III subunit delta', partial [Anaeromyxobacteraceae bacterium]|nr:DNA polymerase III subunit delta' [Anaeromyxobacteraceae bacterium]